MEEKGQSDTWMNESNSHYSESMYEKREEEERKNEKYSLLCKFFSFFAIIVVIVTTVLVITLDNNNDDDDNHSSGGGSITPSEAVVDWSNSTATLVESIPFVDFNLSEVEGVGTTFEAHLDLINNATSTIDISVMYWNLIGDNTTEEGFSNSQLEAFGSEEGAQIFEAMKRACLERNISFRFVQDNSSSFGAPVQLVELKETCPDLVSIHYWNASHFYKGGVMHMKLWIVDDLHVYIGSANMDWLSYTQVKEMGVVIKNDPQIAADVRSYFETWRRWSEPLNTFSGPSGDPVTSPLDIQASYLSSRFRMNLVAPCFSIHVNDCENPFFGVSKYTSFIPTMENPLNITLNNQTAPYFIAGAPQEANFIYQEEEDAFSYRTFDEEGIIETILNADEYVYLSVMDFQPSSTFNGGHGDQPVFWDAFFQALLQVATSKKVEVRVLTSYWAHTGGRQVPYLRGLSSLFNPCKVFDYSFECDGNIQLKIFEVPGWNETTGSDPKYPPFSRVNHAKFIVTDKQINIGTSNYQWGYFYQVAGSSFNSEHPQLISQLTEVFLRDWNSEYATPLANFTEPTN